MEAFFAGGDGLPVAVHAVLWAVVFAAACRAQVQVTGALKRWVKPPASKAANKNADKTGTETKEGPTMEAPRERAATRWAAALVRMAAAKRALLRAKQYRVRAAARLAYLVLPAQALLALVLLCYPGSVGVAPLPTHLFAFVLCVEPTVARNARHDQLVRVLRLLPFGPQRRACIERAALGAKRIGQALRVSAALAIEAMLFSNWLGGDTNTAIVVYNCARAAETLCWARYCACHAALLKGLRERMMVLKERSEEEQQENDEDLDISASNSLLHSQSHRNLGSDQSRTALKLTSQKSPSSTQLLSKFGDSSGAGLLGDGKSGGSMGRSMTSGALIVPDAAASSRPLRVMAAQSSAVLRRQRNRSRHMLTSSAFDRLLRLESNARASKRTYYALTLLSFVAMAPPLRNYQEVFVVLLFLAPLTEPGRVANAWDSSKSRASWLCCLRQDAEEDTVAGRNAVLPRPPSRLRSATVNKSNKSRLGLTTFVTSERFATIGRRSSMRRTNNTTTANNNNNNKYSGGGHGSTQLTHLPEDKGV